MTIQTAKIADIKDLTYNLYNLVSELVESFVVDENLDNADTIDHLTTFRLILQEYEEHLAIF